MSANLVNVPQTFFIFANRLNFVTKHNLEVTRKLCSTGFVVSADRPGPDRDAYIDGTLDYRPFVQTIEGQFERNPNAVGMMATPFAMSSAPSSV